MTVCMKMHFKKGPNFRKSKYMSVHNSPIIKFLFHTKICTLQHGLFMKIPWAWWPVVLSVYMLQIDLSHHLNRFKSQSSDTLKLYLAKIATINKVLLKKTVALHHCGFKLKFPKCYHWLKSVTDNHQWLYHYFR